MDTLKLTKDEKKRGFKRCFTCIDRRWRADTIYCPKKRCFYIPEPEVKEEIIDDYWKEIENES